MANVPELSKNDTAQVLNRLRTQNANKTCFDCGSKNPSWASVTYGIFICIDCSAIHRSLGVHLSFVRSTMLDTSWTWPQLKSMQLGGNGNAHLFFQQHNCNIKDSTQKYNSRVAQLYRDKLAQLVSNSIRVHGYVLDIPNATSSGSISSDNSTPHTNDNFFDNHTSAPVSYETDDNALFGARSSNSSPKISKEGPNVNLEVSNTKLTDYKPSVIGRKPAATKKGLGVKKGFGAQKVTTDFNKVEQEAILAEQNKSSSISNVATTKLTPEEQDEKLNSIKLAYQEKLKVTEDKFKTSNPNKVAQIERLGMGFAGNRHSAISHSAVTDMKIIEQVNPVTTSTKKDYSNDSFMNDLGFSTSSSTTSSSAYKDLMKRNDDDFWNDNGAFDKKPSKKPDIIESIATLDLDGSHSKSARNKPITSTSLASSGNKGNTSKYSSEDAQKKFGNAKAISSDQFFENDKSRFEDRNSSTRFEGSRGISSDDYFGRSTDNQASMSANFNSANLYDIKEGVKDSVKNIAGRLSNMASGVVKTINNLDVMS